MRVIETHETVPCGECITTEYFDGANLVRRDVRIEVDSNVLKGLVGNGDNPSGLQLVQDRSTDRDA